MNGVLIVNKPLEKTSHDIVYKVKKVTGEKVGHTGTLDPMATGVLPLLIGKATLCSKYLMNHDKVYDVTLQLGIKTSTGDREGDVIEKRKVDKELLSTENVKKVFKTFICKQEQMPPIYSAIKVKGKKLYEYARKGEQVEIKPRQIEIYDMQLKELDIQENTIKFEVKCSKGTYIRSLCGDIAQKLNSVGYMKELNRIQVGDFNIKDSVEFKEIQDIDNPKAVLEKIEENLITIEKIFESKPEIELSQKKLSLLLNGVKISVPRQDGIYRIYSNDRFIGIGIIKNNLLKRDIII